MNRQRPTESFPNIEKYIQTKWDSDTTFAESLNNTRLGNSYVFFDGPPFATGLPHHGNLLASVIKDIVPRYWTMKGQLVERFFGWDCHGLPIEQEINQQLGMQAHEAVEELGVAGYNDACRSIVNRYSKEWRNIITRLGRWVDFDNDYKTMDTDYMESVWWVFKSLWDKNLVYRGNKVMPVSTGLGTPLSNFEASSNYKKVQDPSVSVLFKLKTENAYVLAWTTTPWTLPSNLALCVGPNIKYVLVQDRRTQLKIYLASDRLPLYQEYHDLEIVRQVQVSHLIDQTYEPLFPYFAEFSAKGAFRIVADDYVSTDEGTGIVHQAPAFGIDDYRIAQSLEFDFSACPVTMNGYFTEEVADFAGQFVKEADSAIITYLKERNRIFDHRTIEHNYPFCYRSQTPLIYRLVPSWFVRVQEHRDMLVELNQTINWVPEHIRAGRMGNWLRDAHDWCVSRNRVWGTPIPIWENESTGNYVCIGSRSELQELTGIELDDLHREHVDSLTFCKPGEEGEYRRVPEVLDCWFESGSMPYAQIHYPFENQHKFAQGFPAEFIAEGLDQTRGWFYTLLVISGLLFQKPPFKNVIVNGLVLASDGKKMSKSLKNYTDPMTLMDEYGADAFRLYLINSGLVKGEEQCFDDKGVRDMVRRALLPWRSAFSFFQMYAKIDGWSSDHLNFKNLTVLDRWILSRLQTLKTTISAEMERYRLDNVVPALFEYIEELTNGYIRLNRARFWGEGLGDDKIAAYTTLFTVIYELTLSMAPFAPFLSDYVYLELAQFSPKKLKRKSVHLCPFPEPDDSLQDLSLERGVQKMFRIVLLGRKQRESNKISLRTPLARLSIIHQDPQILAEIRHLETYIKKELNVKTVEYETDEQKYVDWYAKPNFRALGKRLGNRMRDFQQKFASLEPSVLRTFQDTGSLEMNGELFNLEEVLVLRREKDGQAVVTDSQISVALDLNLTQDLIDEGVAREIVHRIQLTRKEINLAVTDRIRLSFGGSEYIKTVVCQFEQYICAEVLATELIEQPENPFEFTVGDDTLTYGIERV